MSCSRSDVVLLPIPFTDLTSRKVRPAIVLWPPRNRPLSRSHLVAVAQTDFALRDWRAAGLNVACGIKAQIATVEEKLVVKTVGTLSAADQKTLNERLRAWLQL